MASKAFMVMGKDKRHTSHQKKIKKTALKKVILDTTYYGPTDNPELQTT